MRYVKDIFATTQVLKIINNRFSGQCVMLLFLNLENKNITDLTSLMCEAEQKYIMNEILLMSTFL
jgi:hypothetical protein